MNGCERANKMSKTKQKRLKGKKEGRYRDESRNCVSKWSLYFIEILTL